MCIRSVCVCVCVFVMLRHIVSGYVTLYQAGPLLSAAGEVVLMNFPNATLGEKEEQKEGEKEKEREK